jgi:hypothetical protein
MKLYLKHLNSNQFKDAADYSKNPPFPAPEGFTWETGEPPIDLQPFREIPVSERLVEIFQRAIQEQTKARDAKLQKDILKMADIVYRAINLGLYDAAREAIKEPVLPVELEAYRTEMINLIPLGGQ